MKEWILGLLGDLGQFLKVLFKDALQKELKAIMPIAMAAVKQVAADPSLIKGGDKRDAAIEIIKGQLLDSQKQVGMSILAFAVELAVQNFKNAE